MSLTVTPEEALLVEAATGTCAAPVAARTGELNWQWLLELANWHRLLPLLAERLREGDPGIAVPDAVAEVLRAAERTTTARNITLQHERDRVLALLDAADIPVMLLKGAALVQVVYPHIGQRPMADLDLLVPRASVQRAQNAVEQTLGYAVAGARLHRDDDARIARSHQHFPLVKGSVMVEFHHRILDDRPEHDTEAIWARAQRSEATPPYFLQAPEDLLLHVAAHFAFDRIHRHESGLGQLGDVVRISRRFPIDWEAVADRARECQVGDRLFLTLRTAEMLSGPIAPEAVTAALTPASYTPVRGERFVRHRVLRGGPAIPLEQLAAGRSRFLSRSEALERYLRPDDDVVPSLTRLRARRWAALGRRLVREAPGPRELVDDVRLSRWMLSLRS